MRVMFVYTDVGISVGYSCGIGVLSAYLKEHGHETRLIHVSEELGYPLDLERIVRDIQTYDPGLIAMAAVTNQWYYVRQIADHVRRHLATPILVGGHHASAVPCEIAAQSAIDYVCKGEGERPLLTLVDRLQDGLSTDDVPGITMRRKDVPATDQNGLIDNPVCRWIQDLDSLPFEDRGVFQYDKIVDTRDGWAEVIATRGCPYGCTYCFNTPFFRRYKNDLESTEERVKLRDFVRRRSVDSTLQMLHQVKAQYPNVKGFTFVDDVFAVDAKWLAELAPRYVEEIGLPFACTSQPQAFNEAIAQLLKEMGCKVVKMGIEAGNPRIRQHVLNRHISDDVLVQGFTLARRYGLKPQAFNMIGLPTETKENMLETVRLNAKLRAYIVWVSTFMPYPGTVLHDFCIKNDLIDSTKWDDVRSYRGGSVLKEASFTYLELQQIRLLFKWHLNVALDNKCSAEYQRNIDELEAMSETDWFSGQVEQVQNERDQELDKKYRDRQVDHYITKKYVSMFWAKEYGYDIS